MYKKDANSPANTSTEEFNKYLPDISNNLVQHHGIRWAELCNVAGTPVAPVAYRAPAALASCNMQKSRCGCSAKLEKQIKRHARLHSVSADDDDDAGDDKTRRCSTYWVDCVRAEYFNQHIFINNPSFLALHKNFRQLAKNLMLLNYEHGLKIIFLDSSVFFSVSLRKIGLKFQTPD